MVIGSSFGILHFIQFSLQPDLLRQFSCSFVEVIFNDQCSSYPSNMVLAGPPNAMGLSLPLNALAEITISQHYHFNSPPPLLNSHSIPSVPLLTYMYIIMVVIYLIVIYIQPNIFILYMLYTTTVVYVLVQWPPQAQHSQPIKSH